MADIEEDYLGPALRAEQRLAALLPSDEETNGSVDGALSSVCDARIHEVAHKQHQANNAGLAADRTYVNYLLRQHSEEKAGSPFGSSSAQKDEAAPTIEEQVRSVRMETNVGEMHRRMATAYSIGNPSGKRNRAKYGSKSSKTPAVRTRPFRSFFSLLRAILRYHAPEGVTTEEALKTVASWHETEDAFRTSWAWSFPDFKFLVPYALNYLQCLKSSQASLFVGMAPLVRREAGSPCRWKWIAPLELESERTLLLLSCHFLDTWRGCRPELDGLDRSTLAAFHKYSSSTGLHRLGFPSDHVDDAPAIVPEYPLFFRQHPRRRLEDVNAIPEELQFMRADIKLKRTSVAATPKPSRDAALAVADTLESQTRAAEPEPEEPSSDDEDLSFVINPHIPSSGSKRSKGASAKTSKSFVNMLPAEVESLRRQEAERFAKPHLPFTYNIKRKGKLTKVVVPPVKGVHEPPNPSSKARPRQHKVLRAKRPACVSVYNILRDAVARLPGERGSRQDVCQAFCESRYIMKDADPHCIHSVVSGGLDRLKSDPDPCVRYSQEDRVWIYLHGDRSQEDFLRKHMEARDRAGSSSIKAEAASDEEQEAIASPSKAQHGTASRHKRSVLPSETDNNAGGMQASKRRRTAGSSSTRRRKSLPAKGAAPPSQVSMSALSNSAMDAPQSDDDFGDEGDALERFVLAENISRVLKPLEIIKAKDDDDDKEGLNDDDEDVTWEE